MANTVKSIKRSSSSSSSSSMGLLLLLMVVVLMGFVQVSMATVYKVGDSTGWTTIGNYDYKTWAATKNFMVGDIIVFEYSTQFHNVMQVSHDDYRSCNTTAPFKTYATGNDSITIKKFGHYYYLCGVPGHCQSGQKVDIRVLSPKSQSPSMPPTSPMSPTSSPSGTPTSDSGKAPSPSGTGTPTSDSGKAPSPSGTGTPTSDSAKAPSEKNTAPTLSHKGLVGNVVLAMSIFAGLLAF